MALDNQKIEKAHMLSKQRYMEYGVDTDKALEELAKVSISLHCWQGDDLRGFENYECLTMAGVLSTGAYPGKARNADELRSDLDKAYSLIPGKHRLNLHSCYAEIGDKKVERDQLQPEHFANWIDWAKDRSIGMDFNPTCFAHPKANSGFTLASYNEGIRRFWIDHCFACRKIGASMGKQLGTPCITNLWIPDGFKDIPVDRKKSREILKQSLDEIFSERIDPKYNLDSVESKLFGIGSESCVIGSYEFYLGYAITNRKLMCLDTGHFHPTEIISDKISSIMFYLDEIMLHVSRGVRWDSDHVVILTDELRAIAEELVRGNYLQRVHIGLDFFDASINRISAWVIGTRCMIKALLIALLEPTEKLRQMEISGDYSQRLAMLEELKTLPFGAVWDYYCSQSNVPVADAWLKEVKDYEAKVLNKR